MKKSLKLTFLILVLSGWIAFGIQYIVFQQKAKDYENKITQLNLEINSYKMVSGDIKKSSEAINKIIDQLTNLKQNLENLQKNLDKPE